MNFNAFPKDVLGVIFSHAVKGNVSRFLQLRLVSRRWKGALVEVPLKISAFAETWNLQKLMEIHPRITDIELCAVTNPRDRLSSIARTPHLTHLSISYPVDPVLWTGRPAVAYHEFLALLAKFSQLKSLELRVAGCNLLDRSGLSLLATITPSLTHLAIVESAVFSPQAIEYISTLTGLRSLHLSEVRSAFLLQQLTRLSRLEQLKMNDISLLDDPIQLWDDFGALTNLRELSFGTNRFEEDIEQIRLLSSVKLTSLRSLQITCRWSCSWHHVPRVCQISSLASLALSGPPKNQVIQAPLRDTLQSLFINFQSSTLADAPLFAQVTSLRALTSLSISLHDGKASLPIIYLSSLKNLTNLEVDASKTRSAEDCLMLCLCPSLLSAQFYGNISKRTLYSLSSCASLTSLNLGCAVDDRLLGRLLHSLSNMISLRCTAFTGTGECFADIHPRMQLESLDMRPTVGFSSWGKDAITKLRWLSKLSMTFSDTLLPTIPIHITSNTIEFIHILWCDRSKFATLCKNTRLKSLRISTMKEPLPSTAAIYARLVGLRCLRYFDVTLQAKNAQHGLEVVYALEADLEASGILRASIKTAFMEKNASTAEDLIRQYRALKAVYLRRGIPDEDLDTDVNALASEERDDDSLERHRRREHRHSSHGDRDRHSEHETRDSDAHRHGRRDRHDRASYQDQH